jgi:hypothetical protein
MKAPLSPCKTGPEFTYSEEVVVRTTLLISALVIPALLFACSEQPVAPQQDEAGTTLSKVIFDSYVEPLGLAGVVDYVACANDGAGEFVQYTDTGFANVHWFSRTTPSGNEIVTCHIDYQTETPLGFVGLSSGDEYNLTTGEDNCRIITKPKGPQFFLSFSANESTPVAT